MTTIIKLDEICRVFECSAEEVQSYDFYEDFRFKTIPAYGYDSYEEWMNDGYPSIKCEYYVPDEFHYDYEKWVECGCPLVHYIDDED